MANEMDSSEDRERNESGQYAPGSITTISESDVLAAMNDTDDPVVTAGEISNTLDANQRTIRRRLQSLHDAGVIEQKEVGAHAVVWWPVDSTA